MPDDDAPKSQVLPPLGEHRPTRADDVPIDATKATIPLELSPSPKRDDPETAVEAPLELPRADPEEAPAPSSRPPIRRVSSLIAASGAHVLVLLALVSAPPVEFGYGGSERDAISVSIVPVNAIVAHRAVADAAAQAAPSQAAPEPGEDTATSEATPEKAARLEEKAEQSSPPQSEPDTKLAAPKEFAPEAAPEEASEVTLPPKPPEEVKIAVAEPPPKPVLTEKLAEDAPTEEVPTTPAPAAQAQGGVAHGAAPDQPPQPAAAAASPGEIHAYGTAVQMALLAVDQREAKARAFASKAKGTVVVRLSIDDSGGLVGAEIVKSSGRAELDDAALLLIRLATFPPPPPSLAADQRSYIAPIRFQ